MAVLGFREALETVRLLAVETGDRKDQSQPLTEHLDLSEAQGRILAERIEADRDQPAFDRATRDGFAVRAVSWTAANNTVEVVGELRAGEQWAGPGLLNGQAIAIMTGAPMPPGADAVVMLEHVLREGKMASLEPGRSIQAGDNIVPRGAEARQGDPILFPGVPLQAAEIALLATCGRANIAVRCRPRVAIAATGDELVELAEVPQAWQIRNSNSYGLAAMVTACGGDPRRLTITRDVRDDVRRHVSEGRASDLLLISGGVSMGQYDLVEEVLADFGAEFFFTGVRMQPGKPVVFGRLPSLPAAGGNPPRPACLFFGLPGNPVSTQVTFHCFVEPLLRVLRGEAWTGPRFAQATLSEAVAGKPALTRLLPARLSPGFDRTEVRLVPWAGSGDLAANARANGYVVLPETRDGFAAGEVVTVLLR